MKKNVLLILSISLINSQLLSSEPCQAIHHEIDSGIYYHEESSLHATLQKYSATIVPSIVVGANCGIFCALLDHLVPPLWPLFWLGSYGLRTKMVDQISENYNKNHVRHDKMLMELTTIITTWVSYYKMYHIIHVNPPF